MEEKKLVLFEQDIPSHLDKRLEIINTTIGKYAELKGLSLKDVEYFKAIQDMLGVELVKRADGKYTFMFDVELAVVSSTRTRSKGALPAGVKTAGKISVTSVCTGTSIGCI